MAKEARCLLCTDCHIEYVSFDDLCDNKFAKYIPIGTVEFTSKFAKHNQVVLPNNLSYPDELRQFLCRDVWKDSFGNVPEDMFVKPVRTKIFTGGIKKDVEEDVSDNEQVWVSSPVSFTSEFRCYVIDKKVVGVSRYDDGDNGNDELSDLFVVYEMIEAFSSQPASYAIDVGIIDEKIVLVEINDAWALGFYPWGTMTQQNYVELITKRWEEIGPAKNEKIDKITDDLKLL